MADGGRPEASLFEALDRPVLAYAVESEPAVRATNPAFEAADGASAVAPGTSVQAALTAVGVDEAVAEAIHRAASDGERIERTVEPASAECERASVRVHPAGEAERGFVEIASVDADARAERVETFARTVSHDLRNPLDVARIRLDAAEETGDDVHFEKVRDAHDRIRRIASDVLFLTDPADSVEASPVDIDAVADAAWETVDTGDAALDVETAATVAADGAHLQRLFENLFRNAAEHAGPAVTVTVGETDEGFYVADDGTGLADPEDDRLFEPGRSENGGTGLGLAVVAQIADAHDWTVAAGESAAGGARFEFAGVRRTDGD